MNNFTHENTNGTVVEKPGIPGIIFHLWLSGIAVSWICLLIQVSYYIFVPVCRKYDEKVLTMMTVARLANTITEYIIIINPDFKQKFPTAIRFIINLLYFQSDFALVCWMFVFSKNLYDKVVLVFTLRKFNLTCISCVIWICAFATGLVPAFLLVYNKNAFTTYFNVYVPAKLVIVIINSLIFIEIFSVACTKGVSSTRNVPHFVKTAVISFILICTTSLHVFTTDLVALFVTKLPTYLLMIFNVFYIINSFQIVCMTLIFFILARKKASDNSFKNASVRTRVVVT